MVDPNQRALGAVLSGPAFRTRVGGAVMLAANRHVERWAPESTSHRQRSLRSLGFVDRLVTPWVETAQRSASLRMFQSVRSGDQREREASPVSWVFPRPWYQDELDWMAAARQTAQLQQGAPERGMLTTRGTYVVPPQREVPAALHEYVAPSLSLAPAQGVGAQPTGVGFGGSAAQAYSPLVPLAAVQAAALMQRTVAPAIATTPSVRGVLSSLLARTTAASVEVPASRVSMLAPEMVTPPAPRGPRDVPGADDGERAEAEAAARRLAEQHQYLARLEQIARANAARDLAAARAREAAEAQQRADAMARAAEQARRERESAASADRAAEQRRIEDRIAQRLAERAAEQRLHEASRAQAAEHARTPLPDPVVEQRAPEASPAPAEVVAAIAALPPELQSVVATNIARRPDQAYTVIAQVSEQLRAAELMARTRAADEALEITRGPRVLMPSGLGGLVSTIDRTGDVLGERAAHVAPPESPVSIGSRRDAAMLRVPSVPSVFVAPAAVRATSALGATTSSAPAALTHVAWADRWLARFAGAAPASLEAFDGSAAAESLGSRLSLAAPETVFVAPMLASERPLTQRFDDNAETPDDVFLQISAAAAKRRTEQVKPTPAAPPPAQPLRPSIADVVARAAPGAPDAGLGAQLAASPFAPALRHVLPLPTQPSFDVRALFGAGLSAGYLAGTLAAPARTLDFALPRLDYVAPSLPAGEQAAASDAGARAPGWAPATLRSDLLAPEATSYAPPARATTPGAAPISGAAARSMVDAMALPMLLAPTVEDGAVAAPGMVAERALGWSVAHERSSADLAHDFVSPELVLAARVYGLGAADAAMAARLALAGPSQLTAMAGVVDRTFVQAMAVEADRARIAAAYPAAAAAGGTAAPAPAPAPAAFGVERRAPRGTYLWPAATVAALGMTAPPPDGDHGMSIAALELLAARAVAELGTFAALNAGARTVEPSAEATVTDDARPAPTTAPAPAPTTAQSRARFDALYLAIGATPEGRTISPAARAARALALAGRGEDAPLSAYERAAAAWNVLPVVYAAEASGTAPTTAERTARRGGAPSVDARPGLSVLSGRAGEALGSYVAPLVSSATAQYAAEVASAAAGEPVAPARLPIAQRAPTAAPELVQTGSRSTSRSGGGEAEIPAWFEKAARKMLAERTGQADGISLAELTLITTTAPQQIAASSASEPVGGNAPAASPSAGTAERGTAGKVDIEQVATEVYEQLMQMMDAARARNGEPYL